MESIDSLFGDYVEATVEHHRLVGLEQAARIKRNAAWDKVQLAINTICGEAT